MTWNTDMNAAPHDRDILVQYDHDADPYQCPLNPTELTDYAAWAVCSDFLFGKGIAIARYFPRHFEAEDEYGTGYWMPAAWFEKAHNDYEYVCNPTAWRELPKDSPQ